jgi:transcriptional regulator with XRE-family HTH domain
MKKDRSLLRVLRAQQEPKVTQSQLARRAEGFLPKGRTMSPQRYWQIENGEGALPDADEQAAIAAALAVKVSDIAWPEFAKAQAS